jgi:ketosteroid isomerase-like protein
MAEPTDKVAILRHIYASYAHGEVQPFLDCLAEDAEWLSIGPPESMPWAGSCCDRQSHLERLQRIGRAMRIRDIGIERILVDGDWAVVLSEWEVEDCASARPQRYAKVDVFRFRDGRIVGVREFYDTASVMAHMGCAPVSADVKPQTQISR